MRRITVATFSVAVSLALAACAERDTTSPRSINPGEASLAGGPNSTACDFNNIIKAGKDYYTSTADSVYDIISAWSTAYKQTGAADNTSFGWRVLNVVAVERLTSNTTTSAFGATFVEMTRRCMADLSSALTNKPQLTLPTALTDNNNQMLIRTLNSGIWEIRTGGALGGPVAGKNKAGATPIRSLGAPVWGVETKTTTTNWPGSITYLVVGYPVHDNNPLLTDRVLIDTNDADSVTYKLTTGLWPFNGFELTTVPTGAISTNGHSDLRVAICTSGNPGGTDGSYYYLVHNDAELVPNSTPTKLCDGTIQASMSRSSWYTRLAQGAGRFFKPGMLYAQGGDDDARGFIGGLPSGWSPQGAGAVDISQVSVTISTQPKNNLADSTDNSLVITATLTGTTTPVPQVRINSVSVLNNKGEPAGAVIVEHSTNLPPDSPTLVTGADGKATLHFAIGKPGAYYIVVSTSLDGTAFAPLQSIKFNVKNQ